MIWRLIYSFEFPFGFTDDGRVDKFSQNSGQVCRVQLKKNAQQKTSFEGYFPFWVSCESSTRGFHFSSPKKVHGKYDVTLRVVETLFKCYDGEFFSQRSQPGFPGNSHVIAISPSRLKSDSTTTTTLLLSTTLAVKPLN